MEDVIYERMTERMDELYHKKFRMPKQWEEDHKEQLDRYGSVLEQLTPEQREIVLNYEEHISERLIAEADFYYLSGVQEEEWVREMLRGKTLPEQEQAGG